MSFLFFKLLYYHHHYHLQIIFIITTTIVNVVSIHFLFSSFSINIITSFIINIIIIITTTIFQVILSIVWVYQTASRALTIHVEMQANVWTSTNHQVLPANASQGMLARCARDTATVAFLVLVRMDDA